MANNEDNRPRNPDAPKTEAEGKQRPDSMRPQRSQPPATGRKGSAVIPPASSAANRRPPRQTQEAPQPHRMTRRAASRYQKDLQRQRQLAFATIGVIGLIVLVLLAGLYQSLIAPNIKTLAEVNGQSISSGDYYKYRKIQLFKRIGQLQQQLNFLQGDQQQQAQAQIQLAQSELNDITNPTYPVDQPTLEAMVANILAEKAAKDQFGITVNNDELNGYLNDLFLSNLYTPTPNATNSAFTATAGAVGTAGAAIATQTFNATTPLPTATPSVSPSPSVTSTTSTTPGATSSVSANTTPGVTSAANLTPAPTSSSGASPAANATGTISATTTVTATATITPTATATTTPLPGDKVQGTIAASRSGYLDAFKKATGLSEDDYKQWELKPQLIKKRVSERLLSQLPKVGDPYPQLRASHILVKDLATAQDLLNQLKSVPKEQLESKFIELARTKSDDTSAAAHNGDLGWFIEGMMVDPFYQAAKKLDVGQLSDPVKTDFGYHIIWLTGKDDKRPLDATEYSQLATTDQNGDYVVYSKWLKQLVDAAKPKYNTAPTPTPVPTQVPAPVFTPVIPPTATSTPEPTTAPPPTTVAGSPTAGATGTPGATTTTAAAATTASAATTPAATPTP